MANTNATHALTGRCDLPSLGAGVVLRGFVVPFARCPRDAGNRIDGRLRQLSGRRKSHDEAFVSSPWLVNSDESIGRFDDRPRRAARVVAVPREHVEVNGGRAMPRTLTRARLGDGQGVNHPRAVVERTPYDGVRLFDDSQIGLQPRLHLSLAVGLNAVAFRHALSISQRSHHLFALRPQVPERCADQTKFRHAHSLLQPCNAAVRGNAAQADFGGLGSSSRRTRASHICPQAGQRNASAKRSGWPITLPALKVIPGEALHAGQSNGDFGVSGLGSKPAM